TFDLQAVRQDYSGLLAGYELLARGLTTLGQKPSGEWIDKVVRAADRWRSLDPGNEEPCLVAADILQLLGAPDLAWEYWTTGFAQEPGNKIAWENEAEFISEQGNTVFAEAAYALACETDPTNAQLVWV